MDEAAHGWRGYYFRPQPSLHWDIDVVLDGGEREHCRQYLRTPMSVGRYVINKDNDFEELYWEKLRSHCKSLSETESCIDKNACLPGRCSCWCSSLLLLSYYYRIWSFGGKGTLKLVCFVPLLSTLLLTFVVVAWCFAKKPWSRSLSERRGGLGRIIRDLNGGVENLYPYF